MSNFVQGLSMSLSNSAVITKHQSGSLFYFVCLSVCVCFTLEVHNLTWSDVTKSDQF